MFNKLNAIHIIDVISIFVLPILFIVLGLRYERFSTAWWASMSLSLYFLIESFVSHLIITKLLMKAFTYEY